ncbi:MAG: SRPBCC family protein [Terracoccus sp.]
MATEQRTTVEIEAPAERVWALLSDVERWPEWTASMSSVTLLDAALAVGSRATVEQPRLPRATWTVTALEEGIEFDWASAMPGVLTVGRHHVEMVDEGHSRVVLTVHQSGLLGPVARLAYGRLTRRYLKLEAAGLKTRCEAR